LNPGLTDPNSEDFRPETPEMMNVISIVKREAIFRPDVRRFAGS